MAAAKTLTAAQRKQRASIAAYASHINHDPRARTAAATRATPANVAYWVRKVREEHPGLPDAEVERRAGLLHRQHMARLSFASSRARQAKAAARRAGPAAEGAA